MWFVPKRDKDADKLLTRVMNITDVVAACRETGYDWFEQLLDNVSPLLYFELSMLWAAFHYVNSGLQLLKKEADSATKPVQTACTQIVDCLVDKVLQLDASEEAAQRNYRLLACFSTLYLFCKVKPSLLTPHATTIQPYLNIKCNVSVLDPNTQSDQIHTDASLLSRVNPTCWSCIMWLASWSWRCP